MFTLQIVGNAYVCLTVWSDLKQFTSEKAWRRISVGGLVAEWYGGERKWGSDCCVRLWYCKPCCGTPGYWLSYVNTHWFSCVCHFGRVAIYFPRGWGLFPRAPLHSTPPPPPSWHPHTRAHVSGKQTNKQTHKLVNTSANPNPCVDYFWAHSHMNPPLRRTLSFRFSLFFTPAVSCSCISSKQPAASLFLSLHCHSSPFISSHTFSILFPSPRLWPISPIIKQWTGGLMECCCMKCWQDR